MMPFKNHNYPLILPSSPRLEWPLGCSDKGRVAKKTVFKICMIFLFFVIDSPYSIYAFFFLVFLGLDPRIQLFKFPFKLKRTYNKNFDGSSGQARGRQREEFDLKQRSLKSIPGFSFIEVMVAITLLAIFGSSLFLVQTSLLSKLTKTHTAVTNTLEIDKQMIEWNLKVQQAFLDKKTAETIKLHQEHNNPDYTIDIKCNPIHKNSALFEDFSEKLFVVQTTIKHDNKQDLSWTLLYFPPHEESKQPQESPKRQP